MACLQSPHAHAPDRLILPFLRVISNTDFSRAARLLTSLSVTQPDKHERESRQSQSLLKKPWPIAWVLIAILAYITLHLAYLAWG